MRGWLTWIAAGVVGGCYSPRPSGDCEVICSAAEGERCPDGFACGTSGLCSAGGNACPGDRSGPETCFGDGIAKPCVPVPPGSLMLIGTINTDADTRCTFIDQPAGGPQLCVIASEQIVIGKPVHAVGSRPLVLVASETITVSAMLDARSVRGETVTGAGATPCPPAIAVGEAAVGAGGAGGSFHGSGGTGAAAEGVPATDPKPPVSFPDHVRGGCPGGAGAAGTSAGGKPGAGGGALYLIAKRQIDVQDVIAANGAGALLTLPETGAGAGGGGGGGGSGGLIVLEAPTLTFSGAARLLAMGGGGAGGGATQGSLAGGDSNTAGSPPFSSLTAPGGRGGITNGGKGGDGSSMTSVAGAPGVEGTMEGGGGGGGGGAGFIMLLCKACSTSGALIIPPPTS